MIKYEGKYIRVVKRNDWEFVERLNTTGSVAVIPVTNDGNLVLVKQYREPLQRHILEMPAGLVGDINKEETIETAAYRELLEETGYHANKLENLGTYVVSPGITTEKMNYVVATDLEKQTDGGGDDTEQIEVFELPVVTAVTKLMEIEKKGEVFVDAKIFACLVFAFPIVAAQYHSQYSCK